MLEKENWVVVKEPGENSDVIRKNMVKPKLVSLVVDGKSVNSLSQRSNVCSDQVPIE